MEKLTVATQLAPSKIITTKKIIHQSTHVAGIPLLNTLLEAMPTPVLLLNRQRQIVWANRQFLALVETEQVTDILGLRPGDVFQCEHAINSTQSCGNNAVCHHCGAMQALLSAQAGQQGVREYLVSRVPESAVTALEYQVWATPITLENQDFVLFAIEDIGDKKRRRALERIFFHNILDTAAVIRETAELMSKVGVNQGNVLGEMVYKTSKRLIHEIGSQRELLAAENNQLTRNPSELNALELLLDLLVSYVNLTLAKDRSLTIDPQTADAHFRSDKTLLNRVLGNMIKNALEAISPGESVNVGCEIIGDEIEFWVHNPTVMSEATCKRIFQRSFSTKGAGRGLGTYEMRLLSERYLDGVVFFESTTAGTTFHARYPRFPSY